MGKVRRVMAPKDAWIFQWFAVGWMIGLLILFGLGLLMARLGQLSPERAFFTCAILGFGTVLMLVKSVRAGRIWPDWPKRPPESE